jgi:hypothetical protein
MFFAAGYRDHASQVSPYASLPDDLERAFLRRVVPPCTGAELERDVFAGLL